MPGDRRIEGAKMDDEGERCDVHRHKSNRLNNENEHLTVARSGFNLIDTTHVQIIAKEFAVYIGKSPPFFYENVLSFTFY